MVSIDRLICVVYPLKFKLISSKKFVFCVVFSLISFQLILNAPNLFFRIKDDIVFNPFLNQTQNIPICTTLKELVLVRDLLDELVRSVIPLIIQVSSSILIIFKLVKSRQRLLRSDTGDRDRTFAVTIVLLNVFFFITQTPGLMATIYLFSTGASKSSIITTRYQAIAYLIFLSTVAFAGLNYILVFFVNIASNRIYRNEFGAILKKMFCKKE